jgi:TetR/AcrR family transcriptional regulator
MTQAISKSKSGAVRDAEATKNSILDAAEEEFARGGLLGARTEAIAAHTGVTKAMIYYYFADKEGLYQAVLERAFARRLRAFDNVDVRNQAPQDALRELVSALMKEAGTNQNLAAIMFYEGIQNQGKFYGRIAIASLYTPLIEILERGIACGQFRKVDTLHAAVNIIGTCVYYFCSTQNTKHLWPQGTDLCSEEMRNAHTKEAAEQIVGGVLKRD